MIIGSKLCRFVSLHHLLKQSQDDFESFANNFALNIDLVTANNYHLTIVLDDFNIKSNLRLREIRHHMRVLKLML